MTSDHLAPGVPGDYYRRIFDAERSHFWYQGMWETTAALLGSRMHDGARLLDAGCGTGGFLRFALERGAFASTAGVDIAQAAIDLARAAVPEAALEVAPLRALPFADGSFDAIVSNDVLQHVPEEDVEQSLRELRRVLTANGTLVLRTNGSRHLRRERDDWRAYDVATLQADLERAGFLVERTTFANAALSALAAARGRVPRAPTKERHGIPVKRPSRIVSDVGRLALASETWWIRRGHGLPYGHTLFALATVSTEP